jgi:chemotaxis signal transduction protein
VIASAQALRDAFDRTFALAPVATDDARESVLMVQAGGDPYAIRLSQIAALFADKRVTWLPGSVRELLGVVAVRGAILPVYDLGALLGYAPAASPRWYVTAHPAFAPDGASARQALQVALAFDRFEGHRRVALDDIAVARAEPHAHHVREVVRIDKLARPLVDLSSVVAAIVRLSQSAATAKE